MSGFEGIGQNRNLTQALKRVQNSSGKKLTRSQMTLIELIRHLDDMVRTDNPSIVYGMRINGVWSEHSTVTVHPYIVGETSGLMDDTGLEYMLELELIDEAVTVAEQWFPNLVPLSDRQKVDAVIYYIENDAYIPRLGDQAI